MVDVQLIGGKVWTAQDLNEMNRLEQKSRQTPLNTYAITGTAHGSIVYAKNEGDARRMFHSAYNGESIVSVKANKGIIVY